MWVWYGFGVGFGVGFGSADSVSVTSTLRQLNHRIPIGVRFLESLENIDCVPTATLSGEFVFRQSGSIGINQRQNDFIPRNLQRLILAVYGDRFAKAEQLDPFRLKGRF